MQNSTFQLLSLSIAPSLLWIVFAVFSVVVLTMTFILLYHWSRYGYNGFYIGFATTVYILGVAILFGSTFISLVAYTQTI